MNCKYCGASLPTKGGHCPSCGRMIPVSQQKEIKKMIDPRWNEYKNKDTYMYKKEQAYDIKIGKTVFFIILIILIIIIIAITKGRS